MELDLLFKGIRNIGKWNWKHWKMELGTLENGIGKIGNEIGNIGKRNQKMALGKLEM